MDNQPIIGEIRTFAFPYAPEGFLPCDGRILKIHANTMLFAYLGAKYGGDGKFTFALPNLPSDSFPGQYLCIAVVGSYPQRY
jgi:microcystin-dependent protein